jgi:anti-sigma B factor antagonist
MTRHNCHQFVDVDAAHHWAVLTLSTDRFSEPHVGNIAKELLDVADDLGHRNLELDLGQVNFLTANALGLLVLLYTKLRAKKRDLVVTNVTSQVYEVFEVTRLVELLDVVPAPRYTYAQSNRCR